MKKLLCILLSAALLLCVMACAEPKPTYQQPVQLYYRTATAQGQLPERVIAPVTAEGAPYADDPQALLNEYLKGTSAEGFQTTFPASTKLLSMDILGDSAELMLNSALSRLTGTDLTLACACIALTVMERTGVTTVCIRSSNSTLDGAEEITMTRDSLILQDLYEE